MALCCGATQKNRMRASVARWSGGDGRAECWDDSSGTPLHVYVYQCRVMGMHVRARRGMPAAILTQAVLAQAPLPLTVQAV